MIDNSKKRKLLTIFAALLMVAFILPSYIGRGGGGRRGGSGSAVLGRYGPDKTPITEDETIIAARKWQMLNQAVINDRNPDPAAEHRTVAQALLPWLYSAQLRSLDINRHPEMFALLVRDAASRGIQVGDDKVQEVLRNDVIAPAGMTPDQQSYLIEGVRDALTIYYGLCDVARSTRMTAPLFDAQYAELANNLRLGIATIEVAPFLAKVSEPNQSQIDEQFAKYGNVLAGGTNIAENPFGFGYRLPDRLRLQVLAIDRKEAVRAARSKKSDYDWDVEAHKYYKQNQDRYNTAPIPGTTVTPAAPAAASQPAIKPFASVKGDIEETLVAAAADAISAEVLRRTSSTLNADYALYSKATGIGAAGSATTLPTSLPTTLPDGPSSTSVGVAYGTFAYLQAVAAKEQARSGLLMRVVDTGKLSSAEELAAQPLFTGAKPTIGGVAVERADGLAVLFGRAAALIPAGAPSTGNELALMAPSSEMINASQDVLLVRTVAQSPAHQPADYKDFEPQLREDYKIATAFAQARQLTAKTAEAAKRFGLEVASRDAKLPYEATQPTPLSRPVQVKGGLTEYGLAAMKQAAGSLLRSANPSDAPVIAVELPRDRKLTVVELIGVERSPGVPPPELAHAQFVEQSSVGTIRELGLIWFDEKELLARTGWVKEPQ